MVLRGVKEAAGINTIVTFAKLVPLGVFVLVMLYAFDFSLFQANFWGGGEYSMGEVLGQVRGTMLVTVFVFIGIEGASVYSRYARRREDVGLATVFGFLGVLCLLVLVTLVPYGVLDRAALGGMQQPSMAGVLEAVVGHWGAVFISIGLLISVLGAYLAWSLLAAEMLHAAASNETAPRALARENAAKAPAAALWLTNILIQLFLVLTLFAQEAFNLTLALTSAKTLIPYVLVAAYGLKLAGGGETYQTTPGVRRSDMIIAGVATIYTLFMLVAGGLKYVLLSAILFAPGTILFVMARREQGKQVFTGIEWILFGLVVAAALFGIYGLTTGLMTI
jgi:arginine:ornithine antiporter/lysine permease